MSDMGSFTSKFQDVSIKSPQAGTKATNGVTSPRSRKRKLERSSETPEPQDETRQINLKDERSLSPTKRLRTDTSGLNVPLRAKKERVAHGISDPLDLRATVQELDQGAGDWLLEVESNTSEQDGPSSEYEDDADERSDDFDAEEDDDDLILVTRHDQGPKELDIEADDDSIDLEDGEEHADDSINVEDTRKYNDAPTASDITAEKERRIAETAQLRDSGWYPSELALFHKMSMRGMEPILPKDWEFDFPSIPRSLFTYDLSEAFIKPYGYPFSTSAAFRAKKILQAAMETGPLVRLAIRGHKNGERWLNKLMKSGFKWIYEDTGLKKRDGWLPVLSYVKGSRNTEPGTLQNRLVKHLTRLEVAWKQKLDGKMVHDGEHLVSFPQLYGVIITHSVLALVSYVPADHPLNEDTNFFGNKCLRLHGLFNFAKTSHDVWNAFAVVILMVHCRDVLMAVLNETGLLKDLGYVEESDPDA